MTQVELWVWAYLIVMTAVRDTLTCVRNGDVIDRAGLDELSEFFHSTWCEELLSVLAECRWTGYRNHPGGVWLAWCPRDGEALFHAVLYDLPLQDRLRNALGVYKSKSDGRRKVCYNECRGQAAGHLGQQRAVRRATAHLAHGLVSPDPHERPDANRQRTVDLRLGQG